MKTFKCKLLSSKDVRETEKSPNNKRKRNASVVNLIP